MCSYASEEFFAAFIFAERMRDALSTLLPPHAIRRNDTERQRDKASLCNNGLVFLLCEGLQTNVKNWLVEQNKGFSTASTTSERLLQVSRYFV